MTTRYAWAQQGDINAFFGLIIDNVAVMIFLLTLITSANPASDNHFSGFRRFGDRCAVVPRDADATLRGLGVGDVARPGLYGNDLSRHCLGTGAATDVPTRHR
ncbi:MAG: hypothetical protein WCJ35_09510 [Planctomycetota bacterium]